jgi:hypothetical protein
MGGSSHTARNGKDNRIGFRFFGELDMGILDEAIREHLELKRQHGADDTELKQLEDEAFGPPARPGGKQAAGEVAAEAPTEFMAQPDASKEAISPSTEEPEAIEPAAPPRVRREPAPGVADIQEPPPSAKEEEEMPLEAEGEIEEEQPAAEHEAVAPPGGPNTEERQAIADQPTEMYDVEGELAESTAGRPADEQDEELEDDDFFDEQRLSDELDRALEAPAIEHESEPEPDVEPEPEPEPISEEEELPVEAEVPDADEDVLEETPDFLEEAPEDDQLWFEQKPPKDFDFDD